MEFATYFREKRKEKKLSLKTLGKLTGLPESYFRHIETGKREPDFRLMLFLSKVLDVELLELLRDSKSSCYIAPNLVQLRANCDFIVNNISPVNDMVTVQLQKDVKDGDIVAIVASYYTSVGILKKIDDNYVILYSTNPSHKPLFMKVEDITILGKVKQVTFDLCL